MKNLLVVFCLLTTSLVHAQINTDLIGKCNLVKLPKDLLGRCYSVRMLGTAFNGLNNEHITVRKTCEDVVDQAVWENLGCSGKLGFFSGVYLNTQVITTGTGYHAFNVNSHDTVQECQQRAETLKNFSTDNAIVSARCEIAGTKVKLIGGIEIR